MCVYRKEEKENRVRIYSKRDAIFSCMTQKSRREGGWVGGRKGEKRGREFLPFQTPPTHPPTPREGFSYN